MDETFREISINKPDIGTGGNHVLSLMFKFMDRDIGPSVVLEWMQSSLFHFNEASTPGIGWEVRGAPPPHPRIALTDLHSHTLSGAFLAVRRLRVLLSWPGRDFSHVQDQ